MVEALFVIAVQTPPCPRLLACHRQGLVVLTQHTSLIKCVRFIEGELRSSGRCFFLFSLFPNVFLVMKLKLQQLKQMHSKLYETKLLSKQFCILLQFLQIR